MTCRITKHHDLQRDCLQRHKPRTDSSALARGSLMPSQQCINTADHQSLRNPTTESAGLGSLVQHSSPIHIPAQRTISLRPNAAKRDSPGYTRRREPCHYFDFRLQMPFEHAQAWPTFLPLFREPSHCDPDAACQMRPFQHETFHHIRLE